MNFKLVSMNFLWKILVAHWVYTRWMTDVEWCLVNNPMIFQPKKICTIPLPLLFYNFFLPKGSNYFCIHCIACTQTADVNAISTEIQDRNRNFSGQFFSCINITKNPTNLDVKSEKSPIKIWSDLLVHGVIFISLLT